MTTPTLFKEILVGPYTFRLLIQDQLPCVEIDQRLFQNVWLLNQHCSLLSSADYLKEFSEISNFLWKGVQFRFIHCIADYQKHYLDQVELERKHPSDVFPYRLTDYKIFDVSIMHDPLLEEGHLKYFVYHKATGVPYRVVCPFPYTSPSTIVHYQILPIKEEAKKKT